MLQLTDAQVEILCEVIHEVEDYRMDGRLGRSLDGHEEDIKSLLLNHLIAKRRLESFDPQI